MFWYQCSSDWRIALTIWYFNGIISTVKTPQERGLRVNLGDVPHVRTAIEELRPLWGVLSLNFDRTTTIAREDIDRLLASLDIDVPEGAPYDPYHFPNSVRFLMFQVLKRGGYDVNYELGNLPSNGLLIRTNTQGIEHTVRVRKSTRRGGVPGLKATSPMREICQLILGDDFSVPPTTLLSLWHSTPRGIFTGLSVVCLDKKNGRNVLGRVDIPFEAMTVEQRDATIPTDINDLGDLGDLPIEPLPYDEDEEAESDDGAESAQ